MKPETQAAIAARMAEMMGWTVCHAMKGRPHVLVTKHPTDYPYQSSFDPFHHTDDAIAFADWAEKQCTLAWQRLNKEPSIIVKYDWYRNGGWSRGEYVTITPDTPFPAALTLAVCRAVPELRAILEARDDATN